MLDCYYLNSKPWIIIYLTFSISCMCPQFKHLFFVLFTIFCFSLVLSFPNRFFCVICFFLKTVSAFNVTVEFHFLQFGHILLWQSQPYKTNTNINAIGISNKCWEVSMYIMAKIAVITIGSLYKAQVFFLVSFSFCSISSLLTSLSFILLLHFCD